MLGKLALVKYCYSTDSRTRLVILGTGWAGFDLVRCIDKSKYNLTIVSPRFSSIIYPISLFIVIYNYYRNHFVFTPLLAGTCVGTLEHRCITESIRALCPSASYHQSWCRNIEFAQRQVHLESAVKEEKLSIKQYKTYSLPYDKLVIACGATVNTFGISGVEDYAFFLREAEDARRIRARILACFEQASQLLSSPTTYEFQQALLNFVIVGGGPTGVEFAAELHDFIHDDLIHYYGADLVKVARITIFDVADRILGGFDKRLAEYTQERFKRERIQVQTGTRVMAVHADGIIINQFNDSPQKIVSHMVVWATGVIASTLARTLIKVQRNNHSNRLIVDEWLRLIRADKVDERVYALGDCAIIKEKPLPCTAQVAKQQAQYLARCLDEEPIGLSNEPSTFLQSTAPFVYNPKGMMVYVGGWEAIADIGTKEVSGRTAWLVWRSVYFSMAVSWRNKILIPIYWFTTWLFGRDITKL